MSGVWRLGTRGSPLARWQAQRVRDRVLGAGLASEVRLIEIATLGDRDATRMWRPEDPRGVFVTALEEALEDGRVDLAVHSAKDLPSATPAPFRLAAFPERHDPRDVLVTGDGKALDELPGAAVVATGSPRRSAQLRAARPDVEFRAIRGNVETRLRKLEEGRCDAVVLAAAGLDRLGLSRVPRRPLSPEICLPAAAQGALAVEVRAGDAAREAALAQLDDPEVRCAVETERACLRVLDAGCLAPVAVHARVDGEAVRLTARVVRWDGRETLEASGESDRDGARTMATEVAGELRARGASEILAEAREHVDVRHPL